MAPEHRTDPADRHQSGALRAYIALGANLGDALGTLDEACTALRALDGWRWIGCSSFYRTAPIDSSGPDYLNAVAVLEAPDRAEAHAQAALSLLRSLQAIELAHGRLRPYRNAPRTLDLDLLLYGNQVIAHPDLSVPHPRLHQRAFVLRPLLELAPDLVLPDGVRADTHLPSVADQAIERLGA